MDPFSRKLFRNSDARQRLAQMGGIMASSPELASTAEQFRNGGAVGPGPGLELVTIEGRRYIRRGDTLIPLGSRLPGGEAAGALPMTAGSPLPVSDARPPRPDLVGEAFLDGEGVELESMLRDPAAARAAMDPSLAARARSMMETPFTPDPFLPDRPATEPAAEVRPREAGVPSRGLMADLGFEEDLPPADEPVGEPVEEPVIGAEPEPAPAPDTDPMTPEADKVVKDIRDGFGIPEPDRPPRNRRERVEQELDLIKEIFGHRNKDEARERAMNLAMIGLAIAAGQSPNALVNIAQGALAGTQAMQKAQAAEREREDALRMQAYEAVLGEEKEGRQLERQKELERFRATLAGPAGASTTKPSDPGSVFRSELSSILGAGLDTSIGMRLAEITDPTEKEIFALQTALNTVLTTSPRNTPADEARLAEVVRNVEERISRLRGADAGSLDPAQAATLEAAKKALERNPANRAAIENRLRGAGIDPALL